ncbi:FG-GAP repeat domain-containing protein [Streptomyces sp. NPDC016675]|uniref:FG-GAP repeat domain-containing protein n=1 Tax=Streptomyces sp. NPDC016675 TaxID=3364970 RepID=UPI0036F98759
MAKGVGRWLKVDLDSGVEDAVVLILEYPAKGDGTFADRKRIGGGWGVYNQLTATGNLAGAPAGDLVARDEAGILWLYLGKGDGAFAPRSKISSGWSTYGEKIIGPGDINGDGWSDLVIAPEGNEYPETSLDFLYSTGQWKSPFPITRPSAHMTGLDPLL